MFGLGGESRICSTSHTAHWLADEKTMLRPSLLRQKVASFCLSGCFSKPPDVVVSNGGGVPRFRRACGPRAVQHSARSGPEFGAEGAHRPSNVASVPAQL